MMTVDQAIDFGLAGPNKYFCSDSKVEHGSPSIRLVLESFSPRRILLYTVKSLWCLNVTKTPHTASCR